jgi:hypothetical protein
MPITFNNGVANIVGTPGAASGVFSNRPNAADVADGTLYFSTDTVAIYQAVAGSWVNYSGGSGSTPNLQQVVDVGNSIFNSSILSSKTGGFSAQIDADIIYISDSKYTAFYSFDSIKYFNADTNNTSEINFNNDLVIETKANNVKKGLNLDFQNILYSFGDFDNNNNGNVFIIDDANDIIKTQYGGNDNGLFLDFANSQYQFGQINGVALLINVLGGQIDLGFGGIGLQLASFGRICYIGDGPGGYNYTSLLVNDVNQIIKTTSVNDDKGLKLDFANNIFYFGDFNFTYGGNTLIVDDGTAIIKTKNLSNEWGFKLDFANYQYSFGNNSGLNNSTHILIDDNNPKINFVNDSGFYNFKNIPAYTDNADALANGLVVGDIYRHNGLGESQDQLRIVH